MEQVRPWGLYRVLAKGIGYQIKEIRVRPNHRLSLQRHQHRAEHWMIIQGVATVTVDGVETDYQVGQSVDIGLQQIHRVANRGIYDLVFIEIQTGTYFGEDDIERLEDDYDRSANSRA